MHLTNYAINKESEDFVQNEGIDVLEEGKEPGEFENGIHMDVVHAAGEVIEKKG